MVKYKYIIKANNEEVISYNDELPSDELTIIHNVHLYLMETVPGTTTLWGITNAVAEKIGRYTKDKEYPTYIANLLGVISEISKIDFTLHCEEHRDNTYSLGQAIDLIKEDSSLKFKATFTLTNSQDMIGYGYFSANNAEATNEMKVTALLRPNVNVLFCELVEE